jgi:Flp pilus assembly protein TadG
MHNYRHNTTRGSAMILLTTMVGTVLIPLVGLAVDGTILWMLRVQFVAACDSAALAGARSLSVGMDLASQKAAAEATAVSYFKANFPEGYWHTTDLKVTAEAGETTMHTRTVSVNASVTSPLYFMQVIGKKTQVITAKAQSSRRDVNVELVLDRSSSMSGAMSPMLGAAQKFVGQFAEGRDNVGLIVFGGSAIVAFPTPGADGQSPNGPQSNFKSANPNVNDLIGTVKNGGNTGMAQALHMAFQELLNRNQPGALNLIVLFTDGLPNGVVANFNDATKGMVAGKQVLTNNYLVAGNCVHIGDANYPMIGFMSQVNSFSATSNGKDTLAVKSLTDSTLAAVGENIIFKNGETVKGCHFRYGYVASGVTYNSGEKVREDLTQLPPTDLYGNRLDGPYKPADLVLAKQIPSEFGKAAMNAADNQVMTMRASTQIQPVIYAIGYEGGSEKPDETWMRRIANDPLSASYDKTYPAGLYVKAPTLDDLVAAFNRVASEIMRLAL